jgi:hypothetical protein
MSAAQSILIAKPLLAEMERVPRGVEELAVWAQMSSCVAGVVDGLGQELVGLGDQAGQRVQPDGGIAEPVGVWSRASCAIAS